MPSFSKSVRLFAPGRPACHRSDPIPVCHHERHWPFSRRIAGQEVRSARGRPRFVATEPRPCFALCRRPKSMETDGETLAPPPLHPRVRSCPAAKNVVSKRSNDAPTRRARVQVLRAPNAGLVAHKRPARDQSDHGVYQIPTPGVTLVERAKLFRSGRSQAVRLPKGFRLKGTEVYIKHVGNAVVLLPIDGAWDALTRSLAAFSSDFMEERAQRPPQVRDEPF